MFKDGKYKNHGDESGTASEAETCGMHALIISSLYVQVKNQIDPYFLKTLVWISAKTISSKKTIIYIKTPLISKQKKQHIKHM